MHRKSHRPVIQNAVPADHRPVPTLKFRNRCSLSMLRHTARRWLVTFLHLQTLIPEPVRKDRLFHEDSASPKFADRGGALS